MIQYMSSRVSDGFDSNLDFLEGMQMMGQDEGSESFIKQLEKQMDISISK
jgi:hypothetical protein